MRTMTLLLTTMLTLAAVTVEAQPLTVTQYRLTRWARTEREFPKHFRIATAMMRGPATIAEIAEAAQVPHADVADFINANLAVGYAELVPAGPARGPEPARPVTARPVHRCVQAGRRARGRVTILFPGRWNTWKQS